MHREGAVLDFSVEDRAGGAAIPLAYTGTVPDPFREGREVIVTVQKQGGRYVGERNSLITKCPSKYKTRSAEREAEPTECSRARRTAPARSRRR